MFNLKKINYQSHPEKSLKRQSHARVEHRIVKPMFTQACRKEKEVGQPLKSSQGLSCNVMIIIGRDNENGGGF